MAKCRSLLQIVLILCTCVSLSYADEGMWTFDNPPTKQLQQKYGFTPTQKWLDNVRLASVRFNDGGSGSFVSPTGLVLTNHHVALGQLQKMSTPEKDYVNNGFSARSQSEELKCPDLEVNVLVSLEDVTARIRAAEKSAKSEQDAVKVRKQEIANIEKQSLDSTGFRSDVVSLYRGGQYWLYRYKRYTDIRLVFAPEQQAAFFGGDPDNFTYPRYDIDFAIFRIYENDKPVRSDHYLHWNEKGAEDGELVFASGHPAGTQRELTLSQLQTMRDANLPNLLAVINKRLEILRRYSALGPEQAREAKKDIFLLENDAKALSGEYAGLKVPQLFARKEEEEREFRDAVKANPALESKYGNLWGTIAAAEAKVRTRAKERYFRRLGSQLPATALQIVQYVSEVKKPEGERLPGYRQAQEASLLRELLSPAPVYLPMEEVMLAGVLELARAELGPNDPYVKAMLGSTSPEQVAKAAMNGTRMADPAFRKSLIDGGEAAVQASTDPLILLVRKADPFNREWIRWQETEIQSVEVPAVSRLSEARFAAYGRSSYPDATFTLRLAYGTVSSYKMNGTIAPPKTTFYGLYDRAASFNYKHPFDVPARLWDKRSDLDLSTPLNFVSTCDITGGNSGSPVINRNAELVGLIFDGNIESLVGTYVYDENTNRAVAVHSAAIMTALRKVYGAAALADELQGH
jgi:Peptidase S46